jgi:integrase
MGVTVREKNPGEWWIFISHNGRRKAKKIGRDKRVAIKAAKKIEARLVSRDLDIDLDAKDIPTFGVYCKLWLDDYIKVTKRKSTLARYKSIFDLHVKKSIGKIRLDELKRSDIRSALLGIAKKGLSHATVKIAKNVIAGTIEYAIDAEILKMNVSKGVLRKLGMDSHQGRKTINPLTPAEADLVLEACRKHYPQWYALFLTAFRTGMRLGEVLALEWGDIDFAGRFIQVQRSYRKRVLTGTKTGKIRRVDMSDQLHDELARLLTKRKAEGLAAGLGAAVETVFHTRGEHTSQNTMRAAWARVLKKTGLSHHRIHDMRHTYASTLLAAGVSPVYVKEQLGHASIAITVDIYGHLIPNANRDAVNKLDTRQLYATQAQPEKIIGN